MKNEHQLSENQYHYVVTTRGHNKRNQQSLPNIPEFVKKLFSMLDENAYPAILSWGLDGKSFVVIEPTEFSKLILPKHFKHGNFSSFVRQLNKYDFHKIRHQNDDWPFGHQAWEFYHSHFQYKRKELLQGIKRKPTNHTTTKVASSSSNNIQSSSPSSPSVAFNSLPISSSTTIEKSREETRTLIQQINNIQQSHTALTRKLRSLTQNHHFVVETLSTFQKAITTQDKYIQTIVQTKNKGLLLDDIANEMYQSYHSVSLQEKKQLELITNYVKKQQHQFSTFFSPSPGIMIEPPPPPPPPPPILVPPTILPTITQHSTARWSKNPRILLAVSSINNGKIINDQIFHWLKVFGCLVDPFVDPFDVTTHFDLLFVDESILSRNLSVINAMRQNNPWVPLICLCEVVLDQLFLDWMKQGVTDVLARPFEQQSIFKMVDKYCSHLKLP